MGDRASERACLGPLDVDVDPLVVACGVGELVHLLLGDLHVVAVAEVLADLGLQSVDAVDDRGPSRGSLPTRRPEGERDDWNRDYLNQMRS